MAGEIRVSPESVRGYGRQAQSTFNEMHQSLVTLVNDVVSIRYFGPNAKAFKSECGRVAADFASKLSADMGQMADAVRTSTSNIAGSLGGSPIVINVESRAITPPAPEETEFVSADPAGLEAAMPVVTARFNELVDGLSSHLSALQATDWTGTAKDNAVSSVTGFTNSAKSKCNAAETSITSYIRTQLESVISADR